MLVKKEIVENSSEDDSDQQYAQCALAPVGVGSLYEANSTSRGDPINVKLELEELDIGPTVLQHMDIYYALNKSTVDGCSKAMRCSRVQEDTEDKLRDYPTPQKAIPKERIPSSIMSLESTVCEYHLASVCSVRVMRLNVFQCDSCHAVYIRKYMLLLHIQTVHAYHPQISSVVKFRKSKRQTAADNKATPHNCDQTAKVDYYEECLQHHTTRSNGFKCDRTFHKPHFLSLSNKLHQRNDKKAATARGTVPSPFDQSRDKKAKTKQKPFECDAYEKGYSSEAGLNLHKRSHPSVDLNTRKKQKKPYQCEMCDARFTKNNDLTRHVRVHTGEKPYQCKICDASFVKNNDLTRHVRVHTGEKPYQCKICDARFARNAELTRHMRVHTGEKPYQCKICNGRFTQSSNLTVHMSTHTGKKRCLCKICKSRFVTNSDLTKHMRVHTGEKPYQCKICDARFAQSGHLTRHRRVHTGEKPYQCKICRTRFAHTCNLIRHMIVHNSKKR